MAAQVVERAEWQGQITSGPHEPVTVLDFIQFVREGRPLNILKWGDDLKQFLF